MKQLRQDERSFWKTATPYRIAELSRALRPPKREEPGSLAAYFTGG